MAKTIAVVIQEDPRKTHRPVEALRIALGLVAGSHTTTVILLGEASRLLSDDLDDIVDADILEKYLPSVEHLEIPFVLQSETDRSMIRKEFHVAYETDETIRSLIQSVDRTLIF
jgi:sulfur relay (sulfurtransferase) DsrF/TusC family protein